MSEVTQHDNKDDVTRPQRIPSVLGWLATVLAIEAISLAAVTTWYFVEILTSPVNSLGGSLLILALSVAATTWVGATAFGAIRGRSWVRGAAVTWQLCQLAVAVGAFQGVFAQPVIGLVILVPTAFTLILLFLPQTTRALRKTD